MKCHGWPIIGWLSATLAGCAAGGDVTLMQQELRDREAIARECHEELKAVQFQLEAAQRENLALRAQLEGAGNEVFTTEYAAAAFAVQDVALHRLSGGIDTDGYEGDDALLVLLQPLDHEGDLRKSPGRVAIELFDMAREPSGRRIGFWQFDPEETQDHWYSGFLMSGYRFELPWQQGYPRHDELTVHARFETLDGRVLANTRQIRVRLLPGAAGPSSVSTAVESPPVGTHAAPHSANQPGEIPPGDPQIPSSTPTLFGPSDASSMP